MRPHIGHLRRSRLRTRGMRATRSVTFRAKFTKARCGANAPAVSCETRQVGGGGTRVSDATFSLAVHDPTCHNVRLASRERSPEVLKKRRATRERGPYGKQSVSPATSRRAGTAAAGRRARAPPFGWAPRGPRPGTPTRCTRRPSGLDAGWGGGASERASD
eukprot:31235-Pelagococcus_subviridis.AAC.11